MRALGYRKRNSISRCSSHPFPISEMGFNHESAYSPAMAFMGGAPFLYQNLGDLVLRQHRTTIFCAHCHEINRRFHPDSIESAQVLMHRLVVTDVGNLGELEMLPHLGMASAALAIRVIRGPLLFVIRILLAAP